MPNNQPGRSWFFSRAFPSMSREEKGTRTRIRGQITGGRERQCSHKFDDGKAVYERRRFTRDAKSHRAGPDLLTTKPINIAANRSHSVASAKLLKAISNFT